MSRAIHLWPAAGPILDGIGCLELELFAHAHGRVRIRVSNGTRDRASNSAHLALLWPVLLDVIAVDTGLEGGIAHRGGRDGASIGRLHDRSLPGEYHGFHPSSEICLGIRGVGIQRHLIRRIARMSKVEGKGVRP